MLSTATTILRNIWIIAYPIVIPTIAAIGTLLLIPSNSESIYGSFGWTLFELMAAFLVALCTALLISRIRDKRIGRT